MKWIKASDRLPNARGKENLVIIRRFNIFNDAWGNAIYHRFVSYGFVNYDEKNPTFYYEIGGKSFLLNDTIEWLDESPCEGVLLQTEELENWGYEKKNLEMQIAHRQYLIEAQKEYIEFLDKHITSMASYMHVHGMDASKEDVDKGIELRNKISSLTSKTEVK